MNKTLANFASIRTKLNSPHYLQEAMPRPRLTSLSDKIRNLKLFSVIAAPGFGKSTLLSQLRHQMLHLDLQLAWLNIDADDNDPITMTEYLCMAFYQLDKNIGKRSLDILKSGALRSLKELYVALVEDLQQSRRRFILFVDDFHLLQKGESLKLWQWFIEHLPEQLTVVIASRKALPFPLKRLQLSRQYQTLPPEELPFTYTEVQDFFLKYHRRQISEDLLQSVYKKTEGWIGALQMLLLSMQQSPDPQTLINNFSGENKDIMEYLSEVVLQQIPTSLKNFILSIAVLNRVNAALATRLSEDAYSQAKLEEIEARNLFLIPLDNENNWYRFHHLFQEFLRKQALKILGEAKVQEKYHEASLWFEQEAYRHEAIQYALAGKNFSRAAELISTFALQLVQNQGDHRTMQHWMKQLPEEYLATFPVIQLGYTFSLTFTNRYRNARAELEKLRPRLSKLPPELASTLLSSLELNECLLDIFQDNIIRARQSAHQWLQKWPPSQVFSLGIAFTIVGVSHFFSSSLQAGYEALLKAATLLKEHKVYYAYTWALGCQGVIHESHGQLSQASDLYEESFSEVNKYLGKNFSLGKLIQVMHVNIDYERGDFKKAIDVLVDKKLYIYSFSSTEPNIIYYTVYTRISMLYQQFSESAEYLKEGEKRAEELGFSRFQDQMLLLKIELYLQTERLPEARALLESHNWSQPEEITDEIEDTNQMMANIFARLALSRVLMAEKKFSPASQRLKSLITLLEKIGLVRHLLSANIQGALCEEHLKLHDDALDRLKHSLELAAPEGFISVFLECGQELNHSLYSLLKKIEALSPEAIALRNQVLRQLELFFEQSQRDKEEGLELLDKISARELEILEALDSFKSNAQVAKSLHISPGTLKWHLHKIYQKLDVKNRSGAVLRAKQLELI